MDFTNWPAERDKLKQEIFKELREQRDRKGLLTLSGSTKINPQYVSKGTSRDYGPFIFGTRFQGTPDISFGSIRAVQEQPFWALYDVAKWVGEAGAVEGFYLGLYAVTAPPKGLYQHNVSWIVRGTASQYRAESRLEAWRSSYSYDRASHLHIQGK